MNMRQQEPSLNPHQLIKAFEVILPGVETSNDETASIIVHHQGFVNDY
jgi:hypothetical protein